MLRFLTGIFALFFCLNLSLFGMACPADFNHDGKVDDKDVYAFKEAWKKGDPSADMDGDGKFSTEDYMIFMDIYRNGCIKKSPNG